MPSTTPDLRIATARVSSTCDFSGSGWLCGAEAGSGIAEARGIDSARGRGGGSAGGEELRGSPFTMASKYEGCDGRGEAERQGGSGNGFGGSGNLNCGRGGAAGLGGAFSVDSGSSSASASAMIGTSGLRSEGAACSGS